jgi:hypothetical protein
MVLMRKLEGKKQLLNPGIDGRIILNSILKKQDGRV